MAKLKCEIELDKEGGITLTVEDAKGGRSQVIHVDGVKITMKVKGKSGTSVIVQEEDKVSVTAKTFEVSADVIELKSKKKATVDSKGTLTLKSVKDAKISSRANVKVTATRAAKISGLQLALKGKTKAELGAAQVKIAGKVKAALSAPLVDVNAKAVAKVQGALVQVKAKAILNAQASGLTNIKGSLTNVQGMLVKLG